MRPQERSTQAWRADPGRLTQELKALPRRTTRLLRERWHELIGTAPPGRLSRDLMMRVIADKLQEAALGGLPPAAKRRLAALARSTENGAETAVVTPMLRLKSGSKLVREWRGKTHTVLVLSDGFEHEGQHFTSLTQIARELTGVHWSGPRFFGLTTPQRPGAGGGGNNAI